MIRQGLFVRKECGNAAKTAKFGYGPAPLPYCSASRRCFWRTARSKP